MRRSWSSRMVENTQELSLIHICGEGTITYKSSNTSIATVGKTSGKVTMKRRGACTITAVSYTHLDVYKRQIMCSAASTTQLRTLADACEETAKQLGEVPHHVEGERNSGWVLLDYSAVIVHLFLPEQREFYDLERMWLDAERVDITPFLPQPEAE